MKFIESFQDLCNKIKEHKAIIVIFVDENIMLPSQSLLKFFSFNAISQQLSENIYLFKKIDATVFQHFKVYQYPQVTLIKESPNNVIYSFVGCNQEKASQILSMLCEELGMKKPHMKLNIQKKYCPSQHQMEFINEIDEALYRHGCFQCNGCQMLSHIDSDKPVFHCSVCSYDLCYSCSHTNTIS